MADNATVDKPKGTPEICDWCGRTWRDGVLALVLDSSAVYAHDPDKDGKRLIAACSAEHLAQLQEEYRQRPFVCEELWAWQIARALTSTAPGASTELITHLTGLTTTQINQAIAWHTQQLTHVSNPTPDEPS